MEIIGANGKICINSDKDLLSLAKVLSKGFQIPEFYVKTDMDSPHTKTAMSEAFGFESWLYNSDTEKHSYIFEMATMNNFLENGMNKMHDLSAWMAKYATDVCGLAATVAH